MKAKFLPGLLVGLFTMTFTLQAAEIPSNSLMQRSKTKVVIKEYYRDYDYHFTSRIKRFHNSYTTFAFYSPVYTDRYWYTYQPATWGISIYSGNTVFGIGYSFGYPTWYGAWDNPYIYYGQMFSWNYNPGFSFWSPYSHRYGYKMKYTTNYYNSYYTNNYYNGHNRNNGYDNRYYRYNDNYRYASSGYPEYGVPAGNRRAYRGDTRASGTNVETRASAVNSARRNSAIADQGRNSRNQAVNQPQNNNRNNSGNNRYHDRNPNTGNTNNNNNRNHDRNLNTGNNQGNTKVVTPANRKVTTRTTNARSSNSTAVTNNKTRTRITLPVNRSSSTNRVITNRKTNTGRSAATSSANSRRPTVVKKARTPARTNTVKKSTGSAKRSTAVKKSSSRSSSSTKATSTRSKKSNSRSTESGSRTSKKIGGR